jgi:hypothetical protein
MQYFNLIVVGRVYVVEANTALTRQERYGIRAGTCIVDLLVDILREQLQSLYAVA